MTSTSSREKPGGPLFWATAAIGAAIVVVGVVGVANDPLARENADLARFVLASGLAHDALLAPAIVVVGWVTARWLPPGIRLPVRVGLALSGLLVLLTWPGLRAYGRRVGHPSLLPLPYGTHVGWTLAAVWGIVLAVGVWHLRSARRGADR